MLIQIRFFWFRFWFWLTGQTEEAQTDTKNQLGVDQFYSVRYEGAVLFNKIISLFHFSNIPQQMRYRIG